MKIQFHQIDPRVGDFTHNLSLIKAALGQGKADGVDLVMVGECAITGYPVEDLLLRDGFLEAVNDALGEITEYVRTHEGPDLLFGSPVVTRNGVANAAILVEKSRISVRHKHHLPNYGVFDEKRVFAPGENILPIEYRGKKLGVMICEDLWHEDVASSLIQQGAEILIALNGSPYELGKWEKRLELAHDRAGSIPLLYGNLVGGQDGIVFDGRSFFYRGKSFIERGAVVTSLPALVESYLTIDLDNPPEGNEPEDEMSVLYGVLMTGLRSYVEKTGFLRVILGMSGGLDSAFVAALAADALGGDRVIGVRMPSGYSSTGSLDDAAASMEKIGGRIHTLPISRTFTSMTDDLRDIFTSYGREDRDVTEENLQARIRGTYLMALSNKLGAMLLATGNKSEIAVGYCTLYGDTNGGYAPIASVYKSQVRELAEWRNANIPSGSRCPVLNVIPTSSITKPPSAELSEGQVDEVALLPYDRLDAILTCLVDERMSITDTAEKTGEGMDVVDRFWKMICRNEWKRKQMAPGTKIHSVDFGKDWRMPLTHFFREV